MIVTWDVETRGLTGNIFKLALYDGKETKFFDDSDDFLLALDKLNWSGKRVYLYAHNHRFDLEKLIKDRKRKGKMKDIEIDFDKSIISRDVQYVFTNWQNLYFRDSFKLVPRSLKKATKDFGCKTLKMDLKDKIKGFDYKDEDDFFMKVDKDDQTLLEYLDNDVRSLYELLFKFQEITGASFSKMLTVASVAMDVFKREYSEDFERITKINGKDIILSKDKKDLVTRSYMGGRVEAIKRYIDKCYSYDVNSLYPYVIRNRYYPVGYNNYYTGKDAVERFKQLARKQDKLAIVEASVFVPQRKIAPLPVRIDNKLIFPHGLFTGVWTTEELFYAMRYYGVEVKDVQKLLVWEDKHKPFIGYVDKYYELKSGGTGAIKAVSKLLLNSLYGKFGMKEEVEEYIYKERIEQKKKKEEDAKRQTRILGRDVFIYNKRVFANYIQAQIASFVTSYARLVLLDKIRELESKGYEIYYYDTDGINTNCEPQNFTNLDDKKLGYWKFEGTRKKCYFLAPKSYAFIDEEDKERIKTKGLYNSKFDYQEMQKMVELSKVTHDVVLGRKPPTLLKQLKKEEVIDFEDCKKVLTFLNDKRKHLNNFDTTAWCYDEIINLEIEEEFKTNARQEVIDSIIFVNGVEIKSFDEYLKLIKELAKERIKEQEQENDYSKDIRLEFNLNLLEERGYNINKEFIVDGKGNIRDVIYIVEGKELTKEELFDLIKKRGTIKWR